MASERLRSVGIPGIKYLDQMSRNVPLEGVRFNPKGLPPGRPMFGGKKTTLTYLGVEDVARKVYGDDVAAEVRDILNRYSDDLDISGYSEQAQDIIDRAEIKPATRNFVVFDEDLVQPTKINNIPIEEYEATTGQKLLAPLVAMFGGQAAYEQLRPAREAE
jgi:hypothetical protein